MFSTTKLTLSSLGLAVVLLTSCGGHEEAPADVQVTTDSVSADVKAQINTVRAGIPSPLTLTKYISKAGYNYNKGALNSASKASGYSSKYQAALNLGVYGADFGYAAGFNQSQDVIEYMSQIGKLAKTLGVEAAFNEEFGKEMNDNMGKGDTLTEVIDRAYMKAERNMRSNDRIAMLALMCAGGWVEATYIAASSVADKAKDDKNGELYHELFNHAYAYNYVIQFLELYKSDADCAKMLGELTAIKPVMETLAKNNRPSQEEAKKMLESITAVRNKII